QARRSAPRRLGVGALPHAIPSSPRRRGVQGGAAAGSPDSRRTKLMRHDASRVACRSIAWPVIVALLASSCATKPFKPEADELALWAYGDLYGSNRSARATPRTGPTRRERRS